MPTYSFTSKDGSTYDLDSEHDLSAADVAGQFKEAGIDTGYDEPSALASFGRGALRSAVPVSLGGRVGAMAGGALAGMVTGGAEGSVVPVVGNIVGALIGGAAGIWGVGKAQEALANKVNPDESNPFSTASEQRDVLAHPLVSELGGLALFKPNPFRLGRALQGVASAEGRQALTEGFKIQQELSTGGRTLEQVLTNPAETAALQAFHDVVGVGGNVGIGAGMGILQGQDVGGILKGAGLGALFNQGWTEGSLKPHQAVTQALVARKGIQDQIREVETVPVDQRTPEQESQLSELRADDQKIADALTQAGMQTAAKDAQEIADGKHPVNDALTAAAQQEANPEQQQAHQATHDQLKAEAADVSGQFQAMQAEREAAQAAYDEAIVVDNEQNTVESRQAMRIARDNLDRVYRQAADSHDHPLAQALNPLSKEFQQAQIDRLGTHLEKAAAESAHAPEVQVVELAAEHAQEAGAPQTAEVLRDVTETAKDQAFVKELEPAKNNESKPADTPKSNAAESRAVDQVGISPEQKRSSAAPEAAAPQKVKPSENRKETTPNGQDQKADRPKGPVDQDQQRQELHGQEVLLKPEAGAGQKPAPASWRMAAADAEIEKRQGRLELGAAKPETEHEKYDKVQAKIDAEMDRLEAEGVDVMKLYNNPVQPNGEPNPLVGFEGWTEMPESLKRLYAERDAIGARMFEQSRADLTKILTDQGLKEGEIRRVLNEFAINPDRSDAVAQNHAAEFAQDLAKGDPTKKAEQVAYALAAERGEMVDELRDVSKETIRDAANAVKAVREYLGVGTPEKKGPGLPPGNTLGILRMDATGLLTAAKSLHSLYKGVKSVGEFGVQAVKRFGEWIKPHIDRIWEAAKSGVRAIGDYLKGAWQTAKDHSETGAAGVVGPMKSARDALLAKGEQIVRQVKELASPERQAEVREKFTQAVQGTKDKVAVIVDDLKAMAKSTRELARFTDAKKALNKMIATNQADGIITAKRVKEFIQQVPSESRREATTIYRQADGDMATLQKWAADTKTKDKHFSRIAELAQKLTDGEKAWADRFSKFYEREGNRAVDSGLMPETVMEDGSNTYANHIWKKPFTPSEQNRWSEFSGKLSRTFKFGKKSTFENFYEGIMEGFKPETLDQGALYGIYAGHLSKTVGTNRFIKDMLGGKAEDGNPLVTITGADVTKDKEAGPRLIDATIGKRIEEESIAEKLGKDMGMENPKEFMKAVKDKDAALVKKLTEKALADGVDEADIQHLHGLASGELKMDLAEKLAILKGERIGYRTLADPRLYGWKWVSSDENGVPTLVKGNLAFHPEIATHVERLLQTSALRNWMNAPSATVTGELLKRAVKLADSLSSSIKAGMFGLSPFHIVQEATHGLGHKINPAKIVKIDPEGNPAHMDAMQHGLMLGTDDVGAHQYTEGLTGGGWISKIPILGRLARVISDFTFHTYIPSLKIQTYEAALKRNLARFKPEIDKGDVAVDDVKYLTGKQVNDAYGHLNYKDMGRDPTLQHILRLTLLAPDFLEARTRFALNATQGLVGAKVGREQLAAMALLGGVFYTGARVLNALLNDGDMKLDHPFSVLSGDREYAMRSVPEDIYKLIQDPRKFSMGRLSPWSKTGIQLATQRNYRGEQVSAGDTLKDAALMGIPISARELPGLRDLTETTKNNPVSPWESFLGTVGLHINRSNALRPAYDLVNKFKAAEGKPDTGVYPISRYTPMKNALADGEFDKAHDEIGKLADELRKGTRMTRSEAMGKITSGLHQSIFHSWTGDTESEKKFFKGLTPDQKSLMKNAESMRRSTWHKFVRMSGRGGSLEDRTPMPR